MISGIWQIDSPGHAASAESGFVESWSENILSQQVGSPSSTRTVLVPAVGGLQNPAS
jgi:hypothetical protein